MHRKFTFKVNISMQQQLERRNIRKILDSIEIKKIKENESKSRER